MNLSTINTILINLIILLFPLVINLFYFAHLKNIEKEHNSTLLDFSLLSSLYLFYTQCKIESTTEYIVLLNIPLIIAFLKNRRFVSFIMSIFIICIYILNSDIHLIVLVLEYAIYYIIFILSDKKMKRDNIILTCTIIIKCAISLFYHFVLKDYTLYQSISQISILIVYAIVASLIVYIYEVGEDIIKLHMTAKELEKEKQIRDSLFKITHEIKNPIAVCKSYLDMFDINNEEHEKFIPIVKEEIDKTLLLLQDFLAMNKIKIQKEILDCSLLLEDIVSQFEPVMKSKNITFNYEIIDDEVYIEGDYNRLSQVLINLIKNSIEASDENKKSEISIYTKLENNQIIITIFDNGIGIAEDELKKIKEAFYTTKKNGTGLGVSLSCEIINAHNGTINFISKKYEWTEVEISLPILEMFD